MYQKHNRKGAKGKIKIKNHRLNEIVAMLMSSHRWKGTCRLQRKMVHHIDIYINEWIKWQKRFNLNDTCNITGENSMWTKHGMAKLTLWPSTVHHQLFDYIDSLTTFSWNKRKTHTQTNTPTKAIKYRKHDFKFVIAIW